jgi:hypothetical protein
LSDEKKKREYKTVKIPEEAYEVLKNLQKQGVPITRVLEMLVMSYKKGVEKKIEETVTETKKRAEEIAEAMFRKGFFDIRFREGKVTEVYEDGDDLVIRGYVRLTIPDEEIRQLIKETVKGG